MSALGALLDALPRFTLVAGKGGVGKTTIGAGIALHLAQRGRRTLLVSTDPAGTLGATLASPVGDEPAVIAGVPLLEVRQLSAAVARARFLERWRDRIVEIIDRGTYLDRVDVDGLVDAAMPGADEVFALLTLATLVAEERHEQIVADTAPTGHTLRLLALPRTFEALVALLDTMQEKHRFMVRALTRRYRPDAEDEFLDEMRATIRTFSSTLHDPARGAAVLVARAEPLVAAETIRYAAALRESGVSIAALVVNALPDAMSPEASAALATVYEGLREHPAFSVPVVAPPSGAAQVRATLQRISALEPRTNAAHASVRSQEPGGRMSAAAASRGSVAAASLLRRLTIVGGKGGVGKTTVSCALAIASADTGVATLLVSTDPAPSVADAMAQPIDDTEQPVTDAKHLTARQMDATAAFIRFRDQYRDRIDALFEGLVARGVDASYDRAILRDLLALAPPGMDELYALASLGETLAEGRFERVVVDPAPTGHLLRLLEMPDIALDWSHRFMRMMLKYREITGLGDTAADLLAFAKHTRAFAELLRDPARAGLLIVSLDEPIVREEAARLARAARDRGIDVIGILWNRADEGCDPLPGSVAGTQLFARSAVLPLVGVEALRAWHRDWARLSPAHRHG